MNWSSKSTRRASYPLTWDEPSDTDDSEISDLLITRPPQPLPERLNMAYGGQADRVPNRRSTAAENNYATSGHNPASFDVDLLTRRLQKSLENSTRSLPLDDKLTDQLHSGNVYRGSGHGQETTDCVNAATTRLPEGELIGLLQAKLPPQGGRALLETVNEDVETSHPFDCTLEHSMCGRWSFCFCDKERGKCLFGFSIAAVLLAIVLTVTSPSLLSSVLVGQVVAPVFSLTTGWYFLHIIFLERWRNTNSALTISLICGYGAAGELSGVILASMYPRLLYSVRSLIVVLVDGGFLYYCAPGVGLFRTRILFIVIFIILARSVASSVIFLPATVAPFLVYLLGFIVGEAIAKVWVFLDLGGSPHYAIGRMFPRRQLNLILQSFDGWFYKPIEIISVIGWIAMERLGTLRKQTIKENLSSR